MAEALVSHQDTQHVLAAYQDGQLSEDVFPTRLQSSPRTPPAARGRGFVTIGSIATVHAQLSDLEKMKEMCQQQDGVLCVTILLNILSLVCFEYRCLCIVSP